MNTLEIASRLTHLKCFKGVYPKDLLPQKVYKERPIAFVINTDKSDKPGEHWVALVIDKNNIAEYFDSFGFSPICCEIRSLLFKNKISSITYNKYQIQSYLSLTCGVYCILYIEMRCNNSSFRQFINLFSDNHLMNDYLVTKLI